MKNRNILSKAEKFLYHITPPFYLVALMLGFLTLIPLIISPYIDKKNNEYKLAIIQETRRLNQISAEIYQKKQTIAEHENILMLDYAMQLTSGKYLTSRQRLEIADVIAEQSEIHNIDPLLLIALIHVESTFNPNALSHKGAKGLMQLLPDTAKYINNKTNKGIMNTNNLFDAETNIMLGAAYMEYLLNKTNGNLEYALTAYNMGPSNMFRAKRKNRLPKAYSSKVMKEYNKLLQAVKTTAMAQN